MTTRFPEGFRLERLTKSHRRKAFKCENPDVDDWLANKALQNQEKFLSVTKVLLDEFNSIAGYYTLATGQLDYSDFPPEKSKKLPRRMLPVAILAWLGVAIQFQRRGLGRMLLASSLRDTYEASQTFAIVAVIIDCIEDRAKSFYQSFDFEEFPGRPYRLYMTALDLDRVMNET